MMKISNRIFIFLLLSLLPVISNGQIFEASKNGSSVVVRGTSSLHDWDVNLTDFRSGFKTDATGTKITNISDVSFTCKVRDLKSESSLMNKKIYDALKSDNFPEIKFSEISVSDLVHNGENISGNLKGKLTLAGVTRDISFPFKGTYSKGKTLINATVGMAMSDFKITPPTAMLGSLKTGDKITVSFILNYVSKQ